MSFPKSVRWAALAWGLVVFMPVGMNYLAACLLILSLLLAGDRRARAARLRRHVLWWPAVAYVLVTLVALAALPHYPETASNLVHGLRIVLTLALALCLTREEAVWALRGCLLALGGSVLVVGLDQVASLPDWVLWRDLLNYIGNKSISNAILFALAAASAFAIAMSAQGHARLLWGALALALIAIDIWHLPSRTSLLGLALGVVGACVHRWRHRPGALLAGVLGCLVVGVATIATVQPVRDRLVIGVYEMHSAHSGKVAFESWSIRYHMYRHTLDMVRERPWTGWGIGSWNQQWKARGPRLLRESNMPHNDFLWAGAQAGLVGLGSLVALAVAGSIPAWRRRDEVGRVAFVAVLTLVNAAFWNSAMRDAAIGLSLLWVIGVLVRLADESSDGSEGLRT
jgi:O-antigen ligase